MTPQSLHLNGDPRAASLGTITKVLQSVGISKILFIWYDIVAKYVTIQEETMMSK